jgi:hypothetical protein
MRSYLGKIQYKTGLAECLPHKPSKCEALSSSPGAGKRKIKIQPGLMVYTGNPRIWECRSRRITNSSLPGLYSKTLSQKKKKNNVQEQRLLDKLYAGHMVVAWTVGTVPQLLSLMTCDLRCGS